MPPGGSLFGDTFWGRNIIISVVQRPFRFGVLLLIKMIRFPSFVAFFASFFFVAVLSTLFHCPFLLFWGANVSYKSILINAFALEGASPDGAEGTQLQRMQMLNVRQNAREYSHPLQFLFFIWVV